MTMDDVIGGTVDVGCDVEVACSADVVVVTSSHPLKALDTQVPVQLPENYFSKEIQIFPYKNGWVRNFDVLQWPNYCRQNFDIDSSLVYMSISCLPQR